MTDLQMDELDVACHETVHQAPGLNLEQIAVRIGATRAILNNKVLWSAEHNILGLRESIAIQEVTNSRHIVRVYCRKLGGDFVPWESLASEGITSGVLAAVSEVGDVCRAIEDALRDGVITAREEAVITKEIAEGCAALSRLGVAIAARSRGNLTSIDGPAVARSGVNSCR